MNDLYLIDSHAHLDMEQFQGDLDQVIQSARQAGIGKILNVALSLESAYHTIDLAGQYPGLILGALGIHPHDAQKVEKTTLEEIATMIHSHEIFVAWGEIGLDYYWDFSPRQIQQAIFQEQIHLAKQLHLPVIIHCRDAHVDTLSIMREEGVDKCGGIMHCFSGDMDFASACLELNLFLSLAGPITYKKSEHLREIVKTMPFDRLLVETDCPYLAPHPFRGKRNEPAYVRYMVEQIAKIKGLTFPEVESQMMINFQHFLELGALKS